MILDEVMWYDAGGIRETGIFAPDGRAALEMILATYESHRQNRPVTLPLKNRKPPALTWI